ncbi:unnamed protein product [Hyaloperonospora brassicae]|uniref:Uncharacterized protein n=1 Tax=Hyaloperonospora brassicae TaxID=162125 RepID=A0AAV0U1I4_HYABA|nr:unnamed protein product [Hyaloperonospora brassicae]
MNTGESLGLVLNDGHGLVLKAEGDLSYTARHQKNGFFTSIAKKAIDLGQPADDGTDWTALRLALRSVSLSPSSPSSPCFEAYAVDNYEILCILLRVVYVNSVSHQSGSSYYLSRIGYS